MTRDENMMRVEDLAERLQIGASTVWRRRDQGSLPAPLRLGRSVRWRKEDVDAWINDGCPDVRRTKWLPPCGRQAAVGKTKAPGKGGLERKNG